ncbi:hypothetical protein Maes01_02391 [Microbulbifer aestuariivivens]|uniref:Uncharacterized protein n=1 Tax=Microbulbifer aestuariivivens TaxID=1908308 RepID=A0ABP9WU54_9GAMM
MERQVNYPVNGDPIFVIKQSCCSFFSRGERPASIKSITSATC